MLVLDGAAVEANQSLKLANGTSLSGAAGSIPYCAVWIGVVGNKVKKDGLSAGLGNVLKVAISVVVDGPCSEDHVGLNVTAAVPFGTVQLITLRPPNVRGERS